MNYVLLLLWLAIAGACGTGVDCEAAHSGYDSCDGVSGPTIETSCKAADRTGGKTTLYECYAELGTDCDGATTDADKKANLVACAMK